jgi:hypothetical protein
MARLLLTRSTSNSRPDGDAAALINRVGALLLVAHDSLAEAEGRAMGRGAQAPAALVALREFLEDATIQQLSDVIGLTHSATVRLVDRLVADGYVLRQGSGRDGRRSSWSASLAAGWSLGRGASRSVGGCAGCAISEPADGQRVGAPWRNYPGPVLLQLRCHLPGLLPPPAALFRLELGQGRLSADAPIGS